MTTNTIGEPAAYIFTSTLKMEVSCPSESVNTLKGIWTYSATTVLCQGSS